MRFAGLSLMTLLAAPLAANATLVIDPNTTTACGAPTCLLATGDETSQAEIDGIIAGLLGTSVLLYKSEVDGGAEEGSAAGNYTTTYSNTPSDPEDALIVWDGGGFISDGTHLLVKDGNASPAWYLFAIDWDGIEDISLENFWAGAGQDGRGAISHVSIYGGTISVPEPATLSLLGASLLVLGYTRRRKLA